MSRLERHAEIIKLARLLRTEPSELVALDAIDPAVIRSFRESASAALFDADEARLKRVAMASKLLPTPLIALIAEHVFGALLCARVAGLMAPDRAAEVAARLRTPFLADVTLEIDPRHVREVIERIPTEQIVDVGMELAARQEFVTLARFVDFVGDEAIRRVIESLTDNRALLHIAFFVENKQRLNELIGFLPEARLKAVIRLAADDSENLWEEALALMNLVNARWRKRLGELAATLDEGILSSMARAAQTQGLWTSVLPIIAVLAPAHQARLAKLPILGEQPVLESVLSAVDQEDAWAEFLPLVPLMEPSGQATLALASESLDAHAFTRVFECAREAGDWTPVVLLLLHLRPKVHERIKPLVSQLSAENARLILAQADALGVLPQIDSVWKSLGNAS